jgi:hypothetical protein
VTLVSINPASRVEAPFTRCRREVVLVLNGANATVAAGVREFWLLQQAD